MAQAVGAELQIEGRVGVVLFGGGAVNALGAPLKQAIAARLDEAAANELVRAVVLIGAGRMFSAGADIAEFGGQREGPELADLVDMVEALDKPVVAAINGQALGGGLELALGCHFRVAAASARLALPEVKLGIVPGAGGTQRLPRAVGPGRALAMIALGEALGATEALDAGLIDHVVQNDDLRLGAIDFADALIRARSGARRLSERDENLTEARATPGLFDAFRKANARRFRGFEAPEACIRCVEIACETLFRDGLAFERETCDRLMAGAQSLAQRHAFFAEREARKIPDVPADTAVRDIRHVGVIGAGTMGGGIAMNFLNAGVPVTIVEAKPEALERGVGVVRKNYESTARKGRISPGDVETRMALLTPTLDFESLAGCDLVIEAVFEDIGLKREVFGRLDRVAKPGAILASNTSFLDLDEIAACTSRPQDVVGLHFFSPANVMRLMEIVRGEKTARDVVATAMALSRRIGKVAVLVGVCFGFVANRLLAQRQREAQKLVLEGATPWDVDRVIQDFGLPVGPFAMDDIVGVDLGWSRETSKGDTLQELLCERDRRGQKTRAGYYDYDENRCATPSKEVEEIIEGLSAKRGIGRRAVSDAEILERCLYPMVNEGAKILEEGKAIRASDIDVAWLAGFGWPAYRGGPMHWGDAVGLTKIVAKMREFEAAHGEDLAVAPLLEKLAAERSGGFGAYDRAGRALSSGP